MANTNNNLWGRSIKVHIKRQSFNSFIEGAADWAKKNLTTHCKTCGKKTECTHTKITGNNIIAIFRCKFGHTTTRTTKETELKRVYKMRN